MGNERAVGCTEFRDWLTEYQEGALKPAFVAEMDQHRKDCDTCEEFESQLQLTVEALGSLSQHYSAEVMPPGVLDAFRSWRRLAAAGSIMGKEVFLELQNLEGKELENAVTRVHAWSDRKKSFPDEHICAAWDVLDRQSWLGNGVG